MNSTFVFLAIFLFVVEDQGGEKRNIMSFQVDNELCGEGLEE